MRRHEADAPFLWCYSHWFLHTNDRFTISAGDVILAGLGLLIEPMATRLRHALNHNM